MPYAAASFGDGDAETLGAVTATSTGTLITAGAINAKGTWTALGTPTFPYEFFTVSVGASSAAADYVFDIGINDGSGNVFVVAADLRISGLKGAADLFLSYPIPVRLPTSQIMCRCASSTASATLRVLLTGTSAGLLGGGSYSRLVALYTPATSRGVTIDTGATANTKSAWVQMTASTPHAIDAVMLGIGPNADVSRTAATTGLLDIGIGTAGAEYVMIPDQLWGFTTTSDTPFPNVLGPYPLGIPDATRLAARAQSNNTTAGDRTLDLAIWGLVA